ncbi:Zinc finger protein 836 [Plakobranchus ocellatus]|uniref:Zinc finger protein 836 n=1 Tax=Plakobranchus ocellatus TaxID=259542 RepID=A0AAV3YMT8_9GAST|nr:Zinc finger protein 836 [Plakobranchus ocellatus]
MEGKDALAAGDNIEEVNGLQKSAEAAVPNGSQSGSDNRTKAEEVKWDIVGILIAVPNSDDPWIDANSGPQELNDSSIKDVALSPGSEINTEKNSSVPVAGEIEKFSRANTNEKPQQLQEKSCGDFLHGAVEMGGSVSSPKTVCSTKRSLRTQKGHLIKKLRRHPLNIQKKSMLINYNKRSKSTKTKEGGNAFGLRAEKQQLKSASPSKKLKERFISKRKKCTTLSNRSINGCIYSHSVPTSISSLKRNQCKALRTLTNGNHLTKRTVPETPYSPNLKNDTVQTKLKQRCESPFEGTGMTMSSDSVTGLPSQRQSVCLSECNASEDKSNFPKKSGPQDDSNEDRQCSLTCHDEQFQPRSPSVSESLHPIDSSGEAGSFQHESGVCCTGVTGKCSVGLRLYTKASAELCGSQELNIVPKQNPGDCDRAVNRSIEHLPSQLSVEDRNPFQSISSSSDSISVSYSDEGFVELCLSQSDTDISCQDAMGNDSMKHFDEIFTEICTIKKSSKVPKRKANERSISNKNNEDCLTSLSPKGNGSHCDQNDSVSVYEKTEISSSQQCRVDDKDFIKFGEERWTKIFEAAILNNEKEANSQEVDSPNGKCDDHLQSSFLEKSSSSCPTDNDETSVESSPSQCETDISCRDVSGEGTAKLHQNISIDFCSSEKSSAGYDKNPNNCVTSSCSSSDHLTSCFSDKDYNCCHNNSSDSITKKNRSSELFFSQHQSDSYHESVRRKNSMKVCSVTLTKVCGSEEVGIASKGKTHEFDMPCGGRKFKNDIFTKSDRKTQCEKSKAKKQDQECTNALVKKLKRFKRYKCQFCPSKFKRTAELLRHTRKHTGEKPFKCNVCGNTYKTKENLRRHSKAHLEEKKSFECQECGKEFARKFDMVRHMLIHTGERPFTCEHCGKTFMASNDLNKHYKIHLGKKPFKCKICGLAFVQLANYTSHVKIHIGDRPFHCDECGQSFTRKSNLKRHEIIHTRVAPHTCSVCGKSFTRSSDLAGHSKIHTGEKPLVCDICGDKFRQISHLQAHRRRHIVKKKQFEKAKRPQPKEGWKFSEFCKQSSHRGKERGLSCDLCCKKFYRTYNLSRHREWHLSSGIYHCETCMWVPRFDCLAPDTQKLCIKLKPYVLLRRLS